MLTLCSGQGAVPFRKFQLRRCGGVSALNVGLSCADVGILSAGKHQFQHSTPCGPTLTLEEEAFLLTLEESRIDSSAESRV